MVNLNQIKLLAAKVDKAVNLISLLKEENRTLKNTLESSQNKIREFEELINAFKNDQSEIEQTLLNAIKKLDDLEDDVMEGTKEPSAGSATETDHAGDETGVSEPSEGGSSPAVTAAAEDAGPGANAEDDTTATPGSDENGDDVESPSDKKPAGEDKRQLDIF